MALMPDTFQSGKAGVKAGRPSRSTPIGTVTMTASASIVGPFEGRECAPTAVDAADDEEEEEEEEEEADALEAAAEERGARVEAGVDEAADDVAAVESGEEGVVEDTSEAPGPTALKVTRTCFENEAPAASEEDEAEATSILIISCSTSAQGPGISHSIFATSVW
jgi:hypothetical protein